MMIRNFAFILIAIMVTPAWATGPGNNDEIDFLYRFLEGTYHLIGRLPDSNKTYTGKMILKKSDDKLDVIRIIEGKKTNGLGMIETVSVDKIKVLRIRFKDENKHFEATYLIDSDLDNYGRLSGYLYLQKGGNKMPGLEALFIDHRAP